jgi:F-type H+-transporting ATPase subunit epsilon
MEELSMDLKILLPYRIFDEIKDCKSIVIQTHDGSYGILPQRLDCVTALVPGIFSYKKGDGTVHYLAMDEGILIKAGTQVLVSVRNAIGGADLGKLHESVKKEFMDLDDSEKNIRTTMAKMESGFINRLQQLRH